MKHLVDKERRLDDTKLKWHHDRIHKHFDLGERVMPIHMDVGITKYCTTSRCVFCYAMFQKMMRNLIERDVLLQFMRDCGKIGVRSIALIGDGEPTDNPAFYEAIVEGYNAGVDISTSSSGVIIDDDEKCDTILNHCVWMRFNISAGTEEGYKMIHRTEHYKVVCDNIERMMRRKEKLGSKCDIGMQAVFVPTMMCEEMVEEAKLAVELGVDYLTIKQCSLPDDGGTGMMQFDPNDYDKPEVIDALLRAESYKTDQTDILPKWNVMALKQKRQYHGCLAIPLLSEISGNGDWYPCGYMFNNDPRGDELKFGNLHQQSLIEMVESDRYWDIIEKMKVFNVQKDCAGTCRQDCMNIYLADYIHEAKGVAFV